MDDDFGVEPGGEVSVLDGQIWQEICDYFTALIGEGGRRHDLEHTRAVVTHGRSIAAEKGINPLQMELICWAHDACYARALATIPDNEVAWPQGERSPEDDKFSLLTPIQRRSIKAAEGPLAKEALTDLVRGLCENYPQLQKLLDDQTVENMGYAVQYHDDIFMLQKEHPAQELLQALVEADTLGMMDPERITFRGEQLQHWLNNSLKNRRAVMTSSYAIEKYEQYRQVLETLNLT